MRLKDQTSSNAYIQVQSNLKFKLRFNGKRSFIKETFAREVFVIFFDIVRVINYISFYYFCLHNYFIKYHAINGFNAHLIK